MAQQARVALGDPIGELIARRLVVVLIGERPGLSSPDSLGIYLTFAPAQSAAATPSATASRTCAPKACPCALAAQRLDYLARESLRLRLSGVALKDNSLTDNSEAPLLATLTPKAEWKCYRSRQHSH